VTTIEKMANAIEAAGLSVSKRQITDSRPLPESFAQAAYSVVYQEEIAPLIEALEALAKLGNGDIYGNSLGNRIAQGALSTFKNRGV